MQCFTARASYQPKNCFLFAFFAQIFALHITGSIDEVLSKEHKREICRHIYNHQAQPPLTSQRTITIIRETTNTLIYSYIVAQS
jgi:hypothetical protein